MVGNKKSKFTSGAEEVVIRKFQDSDFQILSSFYMEFYNEMREWQGWEESKLDKKESDQVARKSLRGGSQVFLAQINKEPIGFVRLQFWEGAYFVREVFVKKPFRRSGVGSKLLASCEEFALKNGELSLFLTVEPKHTISIKYLIHNGYDTLNMLELRKDLTVDARSHSERQGQVEILGHKLRLLKRKI